MSIESQRIELEKAFTGLEVSFVVEEAMSAKAPGRPAFDRIIEQIEAGHADGLIAWAPDRLARNSIDGGRVIYLLDRGLLRDLRFATYTYENNPQGKFMLSIMFGQSKYYSDALSENVKRGNRTKAEKGWRPGPAPFGYRNDTATRTILVDPAYFPLVRRMFDMVLTGGMSSRQIARIARDEWSLRTRNYQRGGKPIHDSMVHRILTNPFYAGLFVWEGKLLQGKHEALVSLDDFKAVQAAIRRHNPKRPQKHAFVFSGLIRCGACGRAVTAQWTVNRHGSRYAYYRCSRSTGSKSPCRQPSIRAEELDRQVAAWLASLPRDAAAIERLRAAFDATREQAAAATSAIRESVDRALRDAQSQISELTTLRLRLLIDDDEYLQRRRDLEADSLRLARRLEELSRPPEEVIKPLQEAISFSIYAADRFRTGDDDLKRLIVRAACSNPILLDGKLSVEAAEWLSFLSTFAACPIRRGLGDNVKTLQAELKRIADPIPDSPTYLPQLYLARELTIDWAAREMIGTIRPM